MVLSKKQVENKASKLGLELVWDENTIGCRRGKYVCLNPNLLKHQDFLKSTLQHELTHSEKWSGKDFAMDCVEGSMFTNFKFIFKYPKSILSYLPIDRFKGGWYVDITTTLFYIFIIFMIGVFIYVR